jgi:hypothetical protein
MRAKRENKKSTRRLKSASVEETQIRVDTQRNKLLLPHGYEVRRRKE